MFGRQLPNDNLFAKLKGKEGSEIVLTIYRKSENKKLKIKVKRGVIPIKSVDAVLLLDAVTGYIKINRFAETTYDEFKTGLDDLRKKGAKSLVIDSSGQWWRLYGRSHFHCRRIFERQATHRLHQK